VRLRKLDPVLATAVLFAFFQPLRAQRAPASPSGHANEPVLSPAVRQKIISEIPFNPRDITGVWDSSPSMKESRAYVGTFPDKPSMTPWAQALFDKAKPTFGPRSVPYSRSNDPTYQCFPPGTPRVFFHVLPFQIVQSPGRIFMLFEYHSIVRQIFLTDRHPDNIIPSYMGNSIGHWEGNTLIVDTIGFNGKTWVDREGHPSSTDLHVIERIRRINFDTLQDHVTVLDPKAYTKPWTGNFLFRLHPNWHIDEYVCEDEARFRNFEKEELGPQHQKAANAK
jgi:hypothetical protein